MKKLMALLGSFMLSGTLIGHVVACSSGDSKGKKNDSTEEHENIQTKEPGDIDKEDNNNEGNNEEGNENVVTDPIITDEDNNKNDNEDGNENEVTEPETNNENEENPTPNENKEEIQLKVLTGKLWAKVEDIVKKNKILNSPTNDEESYIQIVEEKIRPVVDEINDNDLKDLNLNFEYKSYDAPTKTKHGKLEVVISLKKDNIVIDSYKPIVFTLEYNFSDSLMNIENRINEFSRNNNIIISHPNNDEKGWEKAIEEKINSIFEPKDTEGLVIKYVYDSWNNPTFDQPGHARVIVQVNKKSGKVLHQSIPINITLKYSFEKLDEAVRNKLSKIDLDTPLYAIDENSLKSSVNNLLNEKLKDVDFLGLKKEYHYENIVVPTHISEGQAKVIINLWNNVGTSNEPVWASKEITFKFKFDFDTIIMQIKKHYEDWIASGAEIASSDKYEARREIRAIIRQITEDVKTKFPFAKIDGTMADDKVAEDKLSVSFRLYVDIDFKDASDYNTDLEFDVVFKVKQAA